MVIASTDEPTIDSEITLDARVDPVRQIGINRLFVLDLVALYMDRPVLPAPADGRADLKLPDVGLAHGDQGGGRHQQGVPVGERKRLQVLAAGVRSGISKGEFNIIQALEAGIDKPLRGDHDRPAGRLRGGPLEPRLQLL